MSMLALWGLAPWQWGLVALIIVLIVVWIVVRKKQQSQ